MGKVFKKVTKAVTKPFKAVAKAVTKGVTKVFQAVGLAPKNPELPDIKDPAPPAPEPEQFAENVTRPENIGRRKRNRRAGLRIDLNTGTGPSGTGVNLPVG